MRRSIAGSGLALVLALSVLSASPATATVSEGGRSASEPTTDRVAAGALSTAARALQGTTTQAEPSPTIALRDLFVALPNLQGGNARQADALLARPTDGAGDPYGDGYSRKSRKKCSTHVCLHYVTSSSDKPPNMKWVSTTLRTMEGVWRHHIGKLGYRRPLQDGGRGGSPKFDVYLKNVGAKGYYGYCAPERDDHRAPRTASGFCVLDNDFSRAEFGRKPIKSLRVTAAHEFFHAVQYAYDYLDDRWMMESTATWVEERYADANNDNRQYLKHGQVMNPAVPLDTYTQGGLAQYGNWAFFEYLSQRFGTKIVREIWSRAGAYPGAPNMYSMEAVRRTLKARGRNLATVFAAYSAGNTVPARTYSEGSSWPSAPVAGQYQLTKQAKQTGQVGTKVRHLSSRSYAITPSDSLRSPGWRLKVEIDGPRRRTGAGAHALVELRNGKLLQRPIRLSRKGHGKVNLPFSGRVKSVTVTLSNGSTRYSCDSGTTFSCAGRPKDDALSFAFQATAHR